MCFRFLIDDLVSSHTDHWSRPIVSLSPNSHGQATLTGGGRIRELRLKLNPEIFTLIMISEGVQNGHLVLKQKTASSKWKALA